MIWTYILIVVSMLTLRYPTRHALHMYQQNRYETYRYRTWIQENIKENIPKNTIPLLISIVCLILTLVGVPAIIFIIAQCLMYAYHYAMEKARTYIKPLVYTARVKRQIAVTVILDAIFICLIAFSKWNGALVLYSFLAPWLIMFLTGWITLPIEKSVQKHFLNEAKSILRNHKGLISIGITGSFGKTTTKNIMQAVISEQYSSLMTPASFNTPMGITRTVREMLKPIHEVFVCEMGADHVGDITELMEFVQPSIGVVTSIGPQHLNTFGSQENIIKEKMQMIEMLPKDGFGILNYDNEFIRNYHIQNPVEVVTYGIHHEDVDYRAVDITYTRNGSSFTVVHGEERVQLETKLLGELNILNILSAVACARHLNVSWATIARACKQMKQVEHRLELKKINGYRFIDDAFNANPTGSAMALEVLSMMPGRRIVITPGMIDLGASQDEINHAFGEKMLNKADTVILVGEVQTKPIYEGLRDSGFDMNQVIILAKEKEAFAWVWANATIEDTILLENDLPDAFNH